MKLIGWLLPIVCGLWAAEASAAWLDEVGVEFNYDDNVTRAQLEQDIKSDSALVLSGSKSFRFLDSGQDSVVLTANVAAAAHRDYRGLDNVSEGLALTYRRKLGLGPYVPQLALSGSATRLDFRNGLRNGWLYAVDAEARERLSERWAVHADFRAERRDADQVQPRVVSFIPADVFDLHSRSLGIGGDFSIHPRHMLSFGYTVHDGDIVSTTLRNLPIFLASSAIASDLVFGNDRYAYKMQAVTRVLSVGLSSEVGRQASLNVGIESRDSHAHGGIDYRSHLVRVTYLYDF